ncbi:MAG: carboxypeptidase regulatory-like domain-containing protein [Ignavibacteriaceae bacterium]
MKMITKVTLFIMFAIIMIGEIKAQPEAPVNLKASQNNWGNYVYVNLNWDIVGPMMKHESFNIYRKKGAISDSGSFQRIYSHIFYNSWIDKFVHKGETYSYYVTAVSRDGESNPSDTAEVAIDTNISKAYAYGTVKNKNTGEAIPHAGVSFVPVFGWGRTNVWTDSSGNYTAALYPGTYIILTNAEGYLPEFYNDTRYIFNAVKVTFNSGDSLNFDINLQQYQKLSKYMLSGSIKDSLGNPMKAMVELYNVTANSFHRRFYRAVTDSSGNYSVKVKEGDTLVAYAHSFNRNYFPQFYNDKESFLTADRIGISADTGNINFILVHKPVYNNGISGSVMNSDNMGVESLVLAIRLGVNEGLHRRYTAFSDSLGNYSFTNLYPGNYILLSIPEGEYIPAYFRYDGTETLHWKDADSVVVNSSGMVRDINFVVTDVPDSGEDYVNGKVTDDSGNPVAGALVFAKDDNLEIYSFGITNQEGLYKITGLIPGNYSISSSSYGYSDGNPASVSLDYSSNYSGNASFTMNSEEVTAVNKNTELNSFKLYQNYPNPFNPSTTINFVVPYQARVTLKVFNVLGSEVATLVNGEKPAGSYNVNFNAGSLASGVYFYQLKAAPSGGQAGNFVAVKKLMLIK